MAHPPDVHPRLLAANDRVAHSSLRGQIPGVRFVDGKIRQSCAPVTDILRTPGGPIDRQLLFGREFLVLEEDTESGYSFGRTIWDGYVGYVRTCDLTACVDSTHKVHSNAAHIYKTPNMKIPPYVTLPFGAEVAVTFVDEGFAALEDGGFIPTPQLVPCDRMVPDYVATAERFLGVPYLWGGCNIWGIDCSGLVQACLRAAGLVCPADSDMQSDQLGSELLGGLPLQRGDFVFWRGHVGMMQNQTQLIHANGTYMAVTSEPLEQVKTRITSAKGGSVSLVRRLKNHAP
jgi:NlpC/P60 family protein/dipeptidyl peptidase-like protein